MKSFSGCKARSGSFIIDPTIYITISCVQLLMWLLRFGQSLGGDHTMGLASQALHFTTGDNIGRTDHEVATFVTDQVTA